MRQLYFLFHLIELTPLLVLLFYFVWIFQGNQTSTIFTQRTIELPLTIFYYYYFTYHYFKTKQNLPRILVEIQHKDYCFQIVVDKIIKLQSPVAARLCTWMRNNILCIYQYLLSPNCLTALSWFKLYENSSGQVNMLCSYDAVTVRCAITMQLLYDVQLCEFRQYYVYEKISEVFKFYALIRTTLQRFRLYHLKC